MIIVVRWVFFKQPMNLDILEEYSSRLNSYQSQIQQKAEMVDTLYEEQCMSADKLRLAVYGLLNSGKSTLLNVLTEHYDNDFFKTGDRRVTTQNQEFETDDIIYIDTPGLDGGTQDDINADIGKNKAHLVLFVHNATKELEQEEINLLSNLKQEAGDLAQKSIIIVLTRCDSVPKEDREKVKQKIQQQCSELLQMELDIVLVSSRNFLKSIEETDERRQQAFAKSSYMSSLQELIQERQKCLDPQVLHDQKINARFSQLRQELIELQQEYVSLLVALRNLFLDSLDNFANNTKALDAFIKRKYKKIQQAQETITENQERLDEL